MTATGAAVVVLSVIVAHATDTPASTGVSAEARAVVGPPPAYVGSPVAPVAENATPVADSATDPSDDQRFSGRVGPDLSAALLRAGVPAAQGREYVALLAKAIPLARELSVDDRFDVILERRPDGSLGQLIYAGLDRVARADIALLKWTDGRTVIWVNGEGLDGGSSDNGLQRPVGGRVTSGFGSRFHPILGYRRMHQGVDLAASYGAPIAAAADGRVVSAGWHGGYGNEVAIAHDGGVRTIYGHMSRIAASAGERVRRGQVIGYVGSTGLSTGPHLHFEVLLDGRPINPLTAHLTSLPAGLQGEKLHAFNDQLRSVLLLPARRL